jgi:hypothetical protein
MCRQDTALEQDQSDQHRSRQVVARRAPMTGIATMQLVNKNQIDVCRSLICASRVIDACCT